MPSSRADTVIPQWCERFRNDPLAAGAVTSLRGRANEIWQRAFDLLQRESPEYRNAVDDEFTRESKSHCGELLKRIISVADGRVKTAGADPFDFVRTHASWRARHQVPLIASLHAYRLAHRTYWETTRDVLLRHRDRERALLSLTMLSDFWIQFFDLVGAILAEAHSVEEGLIVAQGTRAHVGLVDDLLHGIPPANGDAQRICTLCGIRVGLPMAVVVARPLGSGNGHDIDLDVTLRSFVRLIEQLLPAAQFGRLIDIRNGEAIALVCSVAETSRGVMHALRRNGSPRRAGSGPPAGVGISRDVLDIAQLPQALEEARLAVDFAKAAQPLMHFSDIDLPELLIRRADTAAVRLIPEWAHLLHSAEDDQVRELPRTIRTFADCSFNVKQTAHRLGVHTNTVYFRLNRINKLTGVDPRTYSGTSLLLTALRLLEHQERRDPGA